MPGHASINTTSSPEEQALLFQQGNEAALAYFFHSFYPALSLFAFRVLNNQQMAEDIASDAFIKTWKMHWKLNSFAGIRAYLYKTVQRDCVHALKQERRRNEVHSLSSSGLLQETPLQQLVSAETYRLVHAAIKTLSPGNRRVITMHFIDGKTNAEIAKELNLHPHTVQTQKVRGLKALAKVIKHSLLLFFWFL
jgi:RNA polymerase sigma-70 factor (ECF subfamily)